MGQSLGLQALLVCTAARVLKAILGRGARWVLKDFQVQLQAWAVDREFVIYFGLLGLPLPPFGSLCGALGLPWGALRLPWDALGLLWGALGLLWNALGLLWGALGLLWGALGLPWGAVGRLLGALG